MTNTVEQFDAIVVGGGMVGAAAALGLAQAGWSVAVIENDAPVPFIPASEADLRISAVSCSSVELLRRLGAWDAVVAMRAAPYRRLETWEWDESLVAFDAALLSLSELGFMVENRVLQLALWQQFSHYSTLSCYCPAKLIAMTKRDAPGQLWTLTLADERRLSAPLVIGADGPGSLVRKFAGIGVTGWQYRQACLLMSIETEKAQQDVTWQRFYPTGPRAFLPLFAKQASLVWYDSPSRIRQLQSLSRSALHDEVVKAFPPRLGNVDVKAFASFPLVRQHAQRYAYRGAVLVGDAAHTLNPLAGQGVNLGYRDVDALLTTLIAARTNQEDYASDAVLQRYQRKRYADNLLMQTSMDLFYKTFSNTLPPLRLLRNLALMSAQRSGKLKALALKYALGL